MPGTASQVGGKKKYGRELGGGLESDKKMPEIDRYCTGVSRRYRPFSIPPGPKRTRWYSRHEVDVFMFFSTAENSCGDPHSFDSHSLGR